jgi:hypothetical protein
MIISLVDEFLDAGCRLLKKNKAAAISNSNDCWIELDADQCHEKVGHALRDLARKTKRKKSNNIYNTLQSQSSAAIATSINQQQQQLDMQQRVQQQEEHNPTNRRSLSLVMANPLDDEIVQFAASHTLTESPIARFVSDNDDSNRNSSRIDDPPPQSYYSRNSFRPSVDFETLENRHDLTLEESLANFKF